MAISRLVGEILLEARQANQALQNIQKQANQTFSNMSRSATQASNATSRSFNQTITQANRLQTSLATVTRGLAALTAGLGLGLGVQQLTQASDSFIRLENRLRAATDGADEFNAVFEQLRGISNETGTVLEENASAFVRFNLNMEQVGGSVQDTIDIIQTLSKSFLIYGTSTTEAIAGTRQLSQAFSSGRLQGDEFRSIMENLPAVGRALARVMGESVGDMRELSRQGLITADVILEAMKLLKDEVDATFSTITPTIAMGMQALRNEFTIWVGEAEKATGIARALTEALFLLSENIEIAAAAFAGFIGVMGLAAIAGAVVVFTSFASIIGGVATALTGLGVVLGGVAAGWALYNRANDESSKKTAANAAAIRDLHGAIKEVSEGVEGATEKFSSLARAQIEAAQKSVEAARAELQTQQALLMQRLEAENSIEEAARRVREGDYHAPALEAAKRDLAEAEAHLKRIATTVTSATAEFTKLDTSVAGATRQIRILHGEAGETTAIVDSFGNVVSSMTSVDDKTRELTQTIKGLKDEYQEMLRGFDEKRPERPVDQSDWSEERKERYRRQQAEEAYQQKVQDWQRRRLEFEQKKKDQLKKIADAEEAALQRRIELQNELHKAAGGEGTALEAATKKIEEHEGRRVQLFQEGKLAQTALYDGYGQLSEVIDMTTGAIDKKATATREDAEAIKLLDEAIRHARKHPVPEMDEEQFKLDEAARRFEEAEKLQSESVKRMKKNYQGLGDTVGKVVDLLRSFTAEAMQLEDAPRVPGWAEIWGRLSSGVANTIDNLKNLHVSSSETLQNLGTEWGEFQEWFANLFTAEGAFTFFESGIEVADDVIAGIKERWAEFKNWFTTYWEENADFRGFTPLLEGLDNVVERLKERWTEFKEWFYSLWEGGDEYSGFGPMLAGLEAAGPNLEDTFSNLANTVRETISGVAQGFSDAYERIKSGANNVGNYLSEMWASVATAATDAWTRMGDGASNVWQVITENFERIKSGASNVGTFLTDMWNSVSTAGANAWERIGTGASNTWEAIKTAYAEGIDWSPLTNAASAAWETIKSGAELAWEAIKTGFSAAWEVIKDFFGETLGLDWSQMVEDARQAWQNIKEGTDTLISEVNGKLKELLDLVGAALRDFANVVKSNFEQVVASIKSQFAAVEAAVKAAVSRLTAELKRLRAAIAAAKAEAARSGGGGYSLGGPVRGAGTATSDSILGWLSNGEYVLRTAAVRKYGMRFLNMLNNLKLPKDFFSGFSAGGLVDSFNAPLRFAGAGAPTSVAASDNSSASNNMTPINLSIFGETFEGLLAPEHTASQLVRYSVGKQNVSTGNKPWWYR